METLAIALAVVIPAAVAAYLLSLRLHPWHPCGACEGSGKTRDRIWRQATGACPKCGGKGRRARLGIRVLQRARARAMTSPKDAHKKADLRRRT